MYLRCTKKYFIANVVGFLRNKAVLRREKPLTTIDIHKMFVECYLKKMLNRFGLNFQILIDIGFLREMQKIEI